MATPRRSERVEATYRHGTLELVLPVKESTKPHRVEVNASPETRPLQAA